MQVLKGENFITEIYWSFQDVKVFLLKNKIF